MKTTRFLFYLLLGLFSCVILGGFFFYPSLSLLHFQLKNRKHLFQIENPTLTSPEYGIPSLDGSILPLSSQISKKFNLLTITLLHPQSLFIVKSKSIKERLNIQNSSPQLYCSFPQSRFNASLFPISHIQSWHPGPQDGIWQAACSLPEDFRSQVERINYRILDSYHYPIFSADSLVSDPKFQKNSFNHPKIVLCSAPIWGELPYWIEQWMEYQLLMGIDLFAFYIFNKNVAHDSRLDPYKEWIKFHSWNFRYLNHWKNFQVEAQQDCLYRYRDWADYVLFIDMDEFPHHRNNYTFKEFLTTLKNRENYREIRFRNTDFHRFNCSYNPTDDSKVVANKYVYRSKPWNNMERSKYMANTDLVWMSLVHITPPPNSKNSFGENSGQVYISDPMTEFYNVHYISAAKYRCITDKGFITTLDETFKNDIGKELENLAMKRRNK